MIVEPGCQMPLFEPSPDEGAIAPDAQAGEAPMPEEQLGRKQWRKAVDLAVAEAHRTGEAVSVIMMDINGTKGVNDELGHDVGNVVIDTVLEIGHTIVPRNLRAIESSQGDRKPDLVSFSRIPFEVFEGLDPDLITGTPARIGGDEAGILLHNADSEGAKIVAERLRAALEEGFDQLDNQKELREEYNVGVAIGFATLRPGMTASELIGEADDAMFDDKMGQLRPLNEEETAHLRAAEQHLAEAKIRPRELPRYIQWAAAQALANSDVKKPD